MTRRRQDTGTGVTATVRSRDGTTIAYLSQGTGPAVIVVPGVLSTAADYSAFAGALAGHFAVHTVERRGRGASGPQGPDYSIVKECEDVLAVQRATGASLLVGHSYGGLAALEVGRNDPSFRKIAVYEPGVSIGGSMPVDWIPRYEKDLAEGRRVDALVDFTLADAPPPINRAPRWLMKLVMLLMLVKPEYRGMLGLLPQNLREWREIARLDSSYRNYREIAADVLLMYGGKSNSRAVDLCAARLPLTVPCCRTRVFPKLDHFGIERTAPAEVAAAVADFFLE
jgi:pimeloyl-ACP methyl ester carboxylesterase